MRNKQPAHRLKIGLVFDDSLDKPDGVQQFVLMLGEWLTATGHDVYYLVGETARTDIPQLHSLSRNINVRFNQNRMAIPLPAAKGPIHDLLAREQFDILHVQVPYSPALAARIIAAASPHTAVVGTFHIAPHSRLVSAANYLLGTFVRKTLDRFDAMTATSAPAQDFARKTFRIPSQVVPLPVRLNQFYDAKPLPELVAGKNVVFLGRLVERKGCQYLLRAVFRLRKDGRWPDGTHVYICGKGPLENQLKNYTRTHRLDDIVTFVGFISEADKPRYLAAADVVVYPSTGGESFGIVLLEAMAASRGGVLAGNNPGYASVLAPHPDSLFSPRDTVQLADYLYDLLHDDVLRAAYHGWQRGYVRQFDVPEVGAQFLRIYEQALHNRPQ
jgi:phosphatidylinositol alpha-mannosyltransferase